MPCRLNKRIAIIVSTPMTLHAFLLHQVCELALHYRVTLVTNMEAGDFGLIKKLPSNIEVHHVPIIRDINVYSDLKAFWLMFRFLNNNKFDLIHSVTPKAGFLSVTAGFFARVPHRLHTFTGQVWATKTGLARLILKFMDRVLCFFATTVLVDSFSQNEFLIQQKILKIDQGLVLADGSISGVDLKRFRPNAKARKSVRADLGLCNDAFMLLFLGRIKREKGVLDLIDSFLLLRKSSADTCLVMVGPDEEDLQNELIEKLGSEADHVRFVPFTEVPEAYMAAADLFVLPSYREGFGTVVIEAAACGVPALATRVYGLSDAIEDGVSGVLFDIKNVEAMATAMEKFALSDKTTIEFGFRAQKRVREKFSQQRLTSSVASLYKKLLGVRE